MPELLYQRRELIGEERFPSTVDTVDCNKRGTILSCDYRHRRGHFLEHVLASARSEHQLQLRTERLLLRRWREADREPFGRMNADPEVMRYMIRTLTRDESDAFMWRSDAEFDQRGYGRWAIEIPGEAPLIGFVGLSLASFRPSPEIGWRLATAYWGRGYATEGARAVIADGFGRVGLREILSWTIPANTRSIAVMERLGMTRDPADDFDHPLVPDGHPAKHHVLYRLRAS